MKPFLLIVLFLITSCAVKSVRKNDPKIGSTAPVSSPLSWNYSWRDPASDFEISNLLSTEVCSAERNYFEDKIEEFPADLKRRRPQSDANDLPQSCVLYAMRRQHRSAETDESPYFATCEMENSKPERGTYKPCVTDGYLNTVYNAYWDVMNCLGLDQKFYFPQLVYESGFHINAISPTSWDAGLGQYTKNGVLRILKDNFYERLTSAIDENEKPSCRRMSQYLGSVTSELAEVKNRCSFLTLPKNPYKSLLFFAVHHLRDEHELRFELKNRNLFAKIEKAGWTNFNKDELVRTLSLLSYNAGVEGTLGHLNKYLNGRLRMKERISAKNFDFSQDLNFLRGRLDKVKGKKAQFKKQTFPEYLWIWHRSYMSELAYIKAHFNRVLGPICTSEEFLKLGE